MTKSLQQKTSDISDHASRNLKKQLPRGRKPIKILGMKYLLLATLLLCGGASAWAWDGFDADTSELVEITPDMVPAPGDTITVRNYDQDSESRAVVESVRRNSRTVEVVIFFPDSSKHTLVMESR